MGRRALFDKFTHVTLMMLLIVVFIVWENARAGTTGKIAGQIIDATTKDPIPSANILLRGTSLGASSDLNGYFSIINIPPGKYALSASMIGYETFVKMDVIVSSDHTTEVNFSVNPTEVQGKEVTVVAQREIVKKDVSSSEIVADGSQVESIPLATNIMDYINKQAGVSDNSIRGGGLDQIGYAVDGLVSVDDRSNRPLMLVNLNTISEISIIKGGFNAEYGNIRSGLINVVTRDPEESYHLLFSGWFSPAQQKHSGASLLSPDNYYNKVYLDPAVCWTGKANGTWDAATLDKYRDQNFQGWSSYSQQYTYNGQKLSPNQWRELYQWQHGMQVTDSLGNKIADARLHYGDKPDFGGDVSFSGAVPLIGKFLGGMTFLASYQSSSKAFVYPTIRDYYQTNNTQVKLQSYITPTMKLSIEGSYGETHTISSSPIGGADNDFVSGNDNTGVSNVYGSTFSMAWYPAALNPFNIYSSMFGLSIDHAISNTTFYNLRISSVRVQNSADSWDQGSYRDTSAFYSLAGITVDQSPLGYSTTETFTAGDNRAMGNQGGGTVDHGVVTTLDAKFDLTSQLNRNNEVKTGFEFVYDDIRTEFALSKPATSANQNYTTSWSQYPIRLGAYVQDKLEFEGMIANLGVRLDYIDANTNWWSQDDPFSKYFTQQYKDSLYLAPMSKVGGHLQISPRVGISHPITENVKLYFSYGHFYSMSSSQALYEVNQGQENQGISRLGDPRLWMQKTVAYELGVDANIADLALLHVAGFYKDIQDEVNKNYYVTYQFSTNNGGGSYSTPANNELEDIRGFEIQLERNFSWCTGFANYTYLVVRQNIVGLTTVYQDPTISTAYQTPLIPPMPQPQARICIQFLSPEDWGPKVFNTHPLSEWIVSPYITWKAGSYDTWNPDGVLGDQSLIVNNVQWKSQWSVDLRLSKRFAFPRHINAEFYADFNNVLNLKYLNHNAFLNDVEKEDYLKSLHLPLYYDSRFANKPGYVGGNDEIGDVQSADKPYIRMPSRDFMWYMNPFSVTVGVRVNI